MSVICQTPTVLITLLDDEKQHIEFKIGCDIDHTHLTDSFCRYTILNDHIMEVRDSLADERFANNILVTGAPNIRFYAGAPLKIQSGERIGSLCVIDNKPNALTDNQKEMLGILTGQVTTILEFELSLRFLKEEVMKVQDSELKLKAIFQSSPTAHVLVDKDMLVLAYNKASADFLLNLNNKIIVEGVHISSLLSESSADIFDKYFRLAMSGQRSTVQINKEYGTKGMIWWEMYFNPVHTPSDTIMGVSLDATNITERVKTSQSIVDQNKALKKIAQIQSHEVRKPVANIIELTRMLNEDDDENFDIHLQFLQSEVADLDGIIHQIVDISDKANLSL